MYETISLNFLKLHVETCGCFLFGFVSYSCNLYDMTGRSMVLVPCYGGSFHIVDVYLLISTTK